MSTEELQKVVWDIWKLLNCKAFGNEVMNDVKFLNYKKMWKIYTDHLKYFSPPPEKGGYSAINHVCSP